MCALLFVFTHTWICQHNRGPGNSLQQIHQRELEVDEQRQRTSASHTTMVQETDQDDSKNLAIFCKLKGEIRVEMRSCSHVCEIPKSYSMTVEKHDSPFCMILNGL